MPPIVVVPEHTVSVVRFLVPVEAYHDIETVLDKELNHLIRQQGSVCRERELDLRAVLVGQLLGEGNNLPQQSELQERLASVEANIAASGPVLQNARGPAALLSREACVSRSVCGFRDSGRRNSNTRSSGCTAGSVRA